MAEPKPKPHALLIPYPLQGHIIPAVHLAIKLATRGLTITFVNTEAIHHQTSLARHPSSADRDDIFAGARASGLDIRYELVNDGLPVDFDRSLNHDEFMQSLLDRLPGNVEALARRVVGSAEPPVTAVIADTFFVWPATVARKLGLPYVSFWTEPALVFTLYYHMDLLRKNGHFDCQENRDDTITCIPGVPAIEPSDLMSYLQDPDTSSVVHRIIFKAFDEAHDADYIICNTVEELELKAVSALQLHKPFYSIGPIFPAGFFRSPVATSLWAESDCTAWLARQPPASVLYVSFGSYAHVSKRELEEIALGVRDSKVRFIWVLRPDIVSSTEPDPLPEGFSEATAGRGLVVPWCRQVEVLSHGAVGGFLTHCGWNSMLESIWCGVPMLCFPLLTDQFTNRRLAVREWRVGVDLGGAGSGVGREEVREKIGRVMGGGEVRRNVGEVRRVLEGALGAEGSSHNNFDRFVEDLVGHRVKGGRVSCSLH